MIVIGYQTTIEMVRPGFELSGDLTLKRLGPVILQTSRDTLRRSPGRTEPGAHRIRGLEADEGLELHDDAGVTAFLADGSMVEASLASRQFTRRS
jgi:hypothetical protein